MNRITALGDGQRVSKAKHSLTLVLVKTCLSGDWLSCSSSSFPAFQGADVTLVVSLLELDPTNKIQHRQALVSPSSSAFKGSREPGSQIPLLLCPWWFLSSILKHCPKIIRHTETMISTWTHQMKVNKTYIQWSISWLNYRILQKESI